MLRRVSHVNLWVHDQDEALAFYTQKLGFEVRDDVTMEHAVGGAGTLIFETEDLRGTYEDLTARGVEFTQAPMDRSYGIDAAFRDPSGNPFRITQPVRTAA